MAVFSDSVFIVGCVTASFLKFIKVSATFSSYVLFPTAGVADERENSDFAADLS